MLVEALKLYGTDEGTGGALIQGTGAGEGNRTLVCSLGSCRSTIELRPRGAFAPDFSRQATLVARSARVRESALARKRQP